MEDGQAWFLVFVRGLNGRTFVVRVSAETAVEEMCNKLQLLYNVPQHGRYVVHKRKIESGCL